jgi:hypothetical protein
MEKIIFKNRRDSLIKHLPKNSALIVPGADLQYRNADSSYNLRQESSFYYLSGFCEPSSLMVLVNNGKSIDSIIFVPEKDKLKEELLKIAPEILKFSQPVWLRIDEFKKQKKQHEFFVL